MLTFEQEVKLAKQQFELFRARGDVAPLARISTPDGAEEVCVLAFGNDAQEREALLIRLVEEHDATRIVFFTDTWTRVVPKDMEYDGVRPSQHPDRTEAMLLYVLTKDTEQVGCYPYTVERRHSGRVTKNVVVWGESTTSEDGDFVGTHQAVRMAMRIH
jgi:hypothetical protein